MIHAGIFDKDGVIEDGEWTHFNAFSLTLNNAYGISIKGDFGYLGLPPSDAYRYFLERHSITGVGDDDIDRLVKEWSTIVKEMAASEGIRPVSGLHDMLGRLKKAGFNLGMVTSAPREESRTCINTLGIGDYFPVVIAMEDTPGRGKPDPAPYAMAVHRLGMRPEECFAVDDASNGVKSATDAGVRCIGLKTPYLDDPKKLGEAGAVVVVSSLREITPDIIRDLERA